MWACADLGTSKRRPVAAIESYYDSGVSETDTKAGGQLQRVLQELRTQQFELEAQNAELRRAERELARSRERFVELYDQAPVGYLTLDEHGVIVEANAMAGQLLRSPRDELLGQRFALFVHVEDRDMLHIHRLRLLESGERQSWDFRMVGADASLFWARVEASVAPGPEGARRWHVAASDITDRKRSEETIRASEARHRLLFEKSQDALMTLAPPSWHFTSGNAATIAMFGVLDEADLLSRTPWQYSPKYQPDGRPSIEKAKEMIEQAMREGTNFFEWTHRRPSGEEFAATVLLTRIELDGQTVLQATVRDETDKARLQARAAQADRLASIGMVAASVAHEINNPLAYVLYNLDSLTEDLPKLAGLVQRCSVELERQVGAERLSALAGAERGLLEKAALDDMVSRSAEALSGIRRIREVSRALGTFERIGRTDHSRVDVNRAVEQAARMAQNQIKFRARLVKQLSSVPNVLASEGKLTQVFLNLLVNAAQAIDEGNAANHQIVVRSSAVEDGVLVEVTDTGSGIAPENLERIFEPFFTTKPIGEGSGLGLSICRNIIAEFGGTMDVQSAPGHGTTFSIQLPKVDADKLPSQRPSSRPPSTEPGVRGRVLVVDDEEAICKTMQRLLGRDHEVVTAVSAARAAEILQTDRGFDLILCDMMMPDMSGMELHASIAAQDHELAERFVFVTGGAFTPAASRYLANVGNRRLEKPFDIAALERTVARAIDRARGQ
jgi:two-component system, cell cycle sensor histidine kinase and response regulator CckA